MDTNVSQHAFGVITTCAPGIRGYPGPPGEQGVKGFLILQLSFLFLFIISQSINVFLTISDKGLKINGVVRKKKKNGRP